MSTSLPPTNRRDEEDISLVDVVQLFGAIAVLILISVALFDVGLPDPRAIGPRGWGALAVLLLVGVPGLLRAVRSA